ncbi:PadR family transcriptional regulator [Nocardia sp. NPDC050175]|uniref:PadR family transcriptional regulator n=1 Tax=Nocardia sp. NPDC050175 TaxID=3364317 RepID=UPI00378ACC8B
MTASAQFKRSPLAMVVLGILNLEPMHPYAIQRRIKEWGKDKVVNVSQRAALYKTIGRLLEAGLVAIRETGRDQQYPERTVYEITDAGRAACTTWLAEMIAIPRNEYPDFPAALSLLMLLGPDRARTELARRATTLREQLAEMDADAEQMAGIDLPRVVMLEDEYLRAVTEAELRWVDGVVGDLAAGTLTWSWDSLAAYVGESAEPE